MDNSLKSLISSAKSVLILLPTNPDFDAVAGATSLYLATTQEDGREINIYSPTPMIVEFNKLTAVNKIKSEIGNKNLAISFKDYNPQGIEKVSWDIDNGEFKLTVVPKVNVAPPNQDQVMVGYMGVAADLVVLIGGRSESEFPALKTEDLKDAKLAHIGINELNIPGKTIASLAKNSSSIAEVIANLIKNSGYKIDADIATNLLSGIETATQEFSIQAVTADTFALIAELMRTGGKRLNQGQNQNFQSNSNLGPGPVPSSWTEPKIFKGTSMS